MVARLVVDGEGVVAALALCVQGVAVGMIGTVAGRDRTAGTVSDRQAGTVVTGVVEDIAVERIAIGDVQGRALAVGQGEGIGRDGARPAGLHGAFLVQAGAGGLVGAGAGLKRAGRAADGAADGFVERIVPAIGPTGRCAR